MGVAPIWEDPAGFEPVAIPRLATGSANSGGVLDARSR
jgi:hypothetical protein